MPPLEFDEACHKVSPHVFPPRVARRFHPPKRPDCSVVQRSEIGRCNAGEPRLGSVFEDVWQEFIQIGVPGFLAGRE